MAERDPIDLLEMLGSSTNEPDRAFREDLLESLTEALVAEPSIGPDDCPPAAPGEEVVELTVVHGSEGNTAMKRLVYPLLAIAAALVLLLVFVRSDDDRIMSTPTTADVADDPSPIENDDGNGSNTTTSVAVETEQTDDVEDLQPSDPSEMPPLPEIEVRTSNLELATAQELLSAIGDEGLTVGTVAETNAWDIVTFDPADTDRVLFADLNIQRAQDPELWRVGLGEPAGQERISWVDEQTATVGGIFQRDGTIIMDPGMFGTTFPILDNGGGLVVRSAAPEFPTLTPSSYNGVVGALVTRTDSCPYYGVSRGFGQTSELLDETENGFARAEILEPGVFAAFPYHPEAGVCAPNASEVSRVWNLETGEPLPDHPLNGLPIARAVVSGDGSRALTIDAPGTLAVIDMSTSEQVIELGTAASFRIGNTMALNHNGTIAVVADDTGTVSVWHVDTGTVLLEVASDARRGPTVLITVAAGVAYDASRIAVLDDGAGEWRIITLDPNDWLERACVAGASLDAATIQASGLDAGRC